MKLFTPLVIAFSMYSKIPMPHVLWEKENMKYAMCFFPLIGVVLAMLLYGWGALSAALECGVLLRAAIAVLLPLLLTGGIHMDGFCDVVDALSSHQNKERRLEILKDSHTGAFAIIGSMAYLVASLGFWSELSFTREALLVLGLGFVLSRTLSGFSAVSFRCARGNGMLVAFANGAQKVVVRVVLAAIFLLVATLLLVLSPAMGAFCLAASLLVFLYYRCMSYRLFGGTTGDLAGYFLTLCELFQLIGVVAAQTLCR